MPKGLWVCRKSQKISTASDQYFLSYVKKKPSRNRVKVSSFMLGNAEVQKKRPGEETALNITQEWFVGLEVVSYTMEETPYSGIFQS